VPLTTETLAIMACTLRSRWPHAVVYRDDRGDLWVEDELAWVARVELGTGTLVDLTGR
jgi:hypothetical protein